jgi:hypothetical protein
LDNAAGGVENESKVTFDITRRYKQVSKYHLLDGTTLGPFDVPYPDKWDEVNDDPKNDDEAKFENLLFVVDAPGAGRRGVPIDPKLDKLGVGWNFEEFVRVAVNGEPLEGNGLKDSRGSGKFLWYSQIQAELKQNGWERTANYNKIGAGSDNTLPD